MKAFRSSDEIEPLLWFGASAVAVSIGLPLVPKPLAIVVFAIGGVLFIRGLWVAWRSRRD